jgi:putative endonuclease
MKSADQRRLAERGGRRAETRAGWWLTLKGYRILGRRVRTPVGELDIVSLSPGGVLCFVEVKARGAEGQALEAISLRQRARIARAAEYFLKGRPGLQNKNVRFDVVTAVPFRLPRHLKDAWRP